MARTSKKKTTEDAPKAAEVKTTDAPKAAEVKPADAPKAAETKPADAPKAIETKKAKAPKKIAMKPEKEKKKIAMKPAKKAIETKAEPELVTILQVGDKEFDITDIALKAYKSYKSVHKRKAVTDFRIYIKPEDNAAYFTINGEGAAEFKVDLS